LNYQAAHHKGEKVHTSFGRIGVILAVIGISTASCQRTEHSGRSSDTEYRPDRWALAWLSSPDRLVFASDELWGDQDAARRSCAKSGIYYIAGDSLVPVRIGWSREVCTADVYRDNVRGKPDGSEAIVANKDGLLR